MSIALNRLAKEDPSFRVHTDEESGQTIISGMGELHLEILVDRMKREFGVEANVGAPQVAYRETIRNTIEQEGKFVRQTGGRGKFGHVWLRLEPIDPSEGKDYEFAEEVVGGVVPKEFFGAVDKGIQECCWRIVTGKQQLRSEEHTSELQSHYSISYAVFCLKK